MSSLYIKMFIVVLVVTILLTAAYKSDKRIEEKSVNSISYVEQRTKFIVLSNGLECVFYSGHRAEAGLSCNWEKFNSTNP